MNKQGKCLTLFMLSTIIVLIYGGGGPQIGPVQHKEVHEQDDWITIWPRKRGESDQPINQGSVVESAYPYQEKGLGWQARVNKSGPLSVIHAGLPQTSQGAQRPAQVGSRNTNATLTKLTMLTKSSQVIPSERERHLIVP
ncbi:hypothetical protein CR513_15521, partial [Mucuna pruriens]